MRSPYLRSIERRRQEVDEDPRIAERRLQVLANLRLGRRSVGEIRPVPLPLPEVDVRSTLDEVEALRPTG
jgi:hypothetical protein